MGIHILGPARGPYVPRGTPAPVEHAPEQVVGETRTIMGRPRSARLSVVADALRAGNDLQGDEVAAVALMDRFA